MKLTVLFLGIIFIILSVFTMGLFSQKEPKTLSTPQDQLPENVIKATFAGGCFWCMEPAFERLEGVYNVKAGFTGGAAENADYYKVASGQTKHREAIEMFYDPTVIDYERLVEVFFWQIDPTDDGGQFADRGFQYTTAIYYHDDEQKTIAEDYIQKLDASDEFDKPVVTVVEIAQPFYDAPEEHQNYYLTNPTHHKLYKKGSGRQDFIEQNNDYTLN